MTHYTLIVEDHPLYREGLGDTLSLVLTDTVVLKACSAEEGLLMTDHLHDVRLICIDLGLPKIQGIDAVSIFRTKFPRAVLIVISGNEQTELQQLAIERGANTFIPKSASPNEIAVLVHRAMAGEWLTPNFDLAVSRTVSPGQLKPFLTIRQSEVLELLAMGMSNKQIARQLEVAEVTVKLHVTGIFRAFGANCRSQALLVARKSGLLPDS
ncbi:response regulator [Solimicrobium silvestre]|uniref:Response regulator containing a CheY-like receiver domain and an HTH DNA-binding domain n=1 Tax=Solimicrobium silvestre TaxID=2099400 RepID=A0A2S9H553_9BURK|nr:response regulator transcription factor [Solimicrobium silvestre]PRC95114.1 Response regulator containing a CheY-like receiver domain and an HTH DNA-binding domain [Solimicrobium silvestre]